MKLRKKAKPTNNIAERVAIDWSNTEVPKHLKGNPKKKQVIELSAKLNKAIEKSEKKAKKRKQSLFSPDEAGERYFKEQEIANGSAKTLAATKAEIIDVADSSGITEGNLKIIRGQLYEVGFLETDPAPKPDLKLAKKYLSADVLQRCIQNVIILDEKKLEKLVEEGVISPATLKKICAKPASQRRIHVRMLSSPAGPRPQDQE